MITSKGGAKKGGNNDGKANTYAIDQYSIIIVS